MTLCMFFGGESSSQATPRIITIGDECGSIIVTLESFSFKDYNATKPVRTATPTRGDVVAIATVADEDFTTQFCREVVFCPRTRKALSEPEF